MSVDPSAPDPLYVQLAGILRGQIERGELAGRVPSIKTLSQEYGVAMGTADKALAVLRDEGLIRSVIGRGAFVVGGQSDKRARACRLLSVLLYGTFG